MARLGMTPTAARRGGQGAVIRFAVGEASLGSVLVAATDKGVCAIMLGDEPGALVRELQDRFPRAKLVGGDENFERTVAEVVGLVEAPGQNFDLPLDIRGTAFQQKVWQALRAIPAGATATYAEIAKPSAAPRRCARSPRPAAPIRSRSRSPAIGWCAPTAASRAIAGASSASASCSTARWRDGGASPHPGPLPASGRGANRFSRSRGKMARSAGMRAAP